MKKRIVFTILMLLIIQYKFSYGKGFQFIQNPAFIFDDRVHLSAEYIYNYGHWCQFMKEPTNRYPSYDQTMPFTFYRGGFSYNKIQVSAMFWQQERSEGYIQLEQNYRKQRQNNPPVVVYSYCLGQYKYVNWGYSLATNGLFSIKFNKSFKKFVYSLSFDKSFWHFIWLDVSGLIDPYSGRFSLAYKPLKNFALFDELKWHKMYFEEMRTGCMNIVGCAYRYGLFQASIFYNLIYDGNEPQSGYYFPNGRYDHRVAFQIKLGY